MRFTPASFTAEMSAVFTYSTWLIRLITVGTVPQTIRMSTGGQQTWDGQTWLALGAQVEGAVSWDQMRFSMPNQDGSVFSLAANGELRRASVELFVMYPDAADAIKFMRGFVSGVDGLMEDRATLTVDRYADENGIVPNLRIAPPGWTKLPPSELSFVWAGKKIVLNNTGF